MSGPVSAMVVTKKYVLAGGFLGGSVFWKHFKHTAPL